MAVGLEAHASGHGGLGKPGAGATSGPGSDRQETSAQEHEVEVFAKQIGDYLDKARTQHRYDELVVEASPGTGTDVALRATLRRYAAGVTPTARRKCRVKWLWSAKPSAAAT